MAYGMGLSASTIKYVVHWKISESILNYWQEVGCSPNHQGIAVLYLPPFDRINIKPDIKELISAVK